MEISVKIVLSASREPIDTPAIAEKPSRPVVSIFPFLESSITIMMPSMPAIPDTIAGVRARAASDPVNCISNKVVNTDAIKLNVARPAF